MSPDRLKIAAATLLPIVLFATLAFATAVYPQYRATRNQANQISRSLADQASLKTVVAYQEALDLANRAAIDIEPLLSSRKKLDAGDQTLRQALLEIIDQTPGVSGLSIVDGSNSVDITFGSVSPASQAADLAGPQAMNVAKAAGPVTMALATFNLDPGDFRQTLQAAAWLYVGIPLHHVGEQNRVTSNLRLVAAIPWPENLGLRSVHDNSCCEAVFTPKDGSLQYDFSTGIWQPVPKMPADPRLTEQTVTMAQQVVGTVIVYETIKSSRKVDGPVITFIVLAFLIITMTAMALRRLILAMPASEVTAELRPATVDTNFRNLFNANAAPIVVIDANLGTIVKVNPAAANVFEMSEIDLIAKPIDQVFRFSPDAANSLKGGTGTKIRAIIQGTSKSVDLTSGKAEFDGGSWTMIIASDAAPEIAAENAASQARDLLDQTLRRRVHSLGLQRDNYRRLVEALKSFNSMIAHEIRNPISIIRAAAQNLTLHADQVVLRRANKIIMQVDELNGIVTRVLTAAKLEANALPPVLAIGNPLEVFNERFSLKGESENSHRYVNLVPDIDRQAKFDRELLAQVFDNVIQNAAKYSPADTEIMANATITSTAIVMSISDQGIGVPDAEKERIFTRYYRATTAKAAGITGNGLGMAICREIIEMFDGRIYLTNSLPTGTIVHIEIPLAAQREIAGQAVA